MNDKIKKIFDNYICYDGPMPETNVDRMTDNEIEKEFIKRFEKYLDDNSMLQHDNENNTD